MEAVKARVEEEKATRLTETSVKGMRAEVLRSRRQSSEGRLRPEF